MERYLSSIAITGLLAIMTFSGCQSPARETEQEIPQKEKENIFYPEMTGDINDFENILSTDEEGSLKNAIQNYEEHTGHEAVIVTVDTVPQNMAIVVYATKLGNKWGVGDKDKLNGLIILLSERAGIVAIVPAKGVENIYTDEITGKIIEERMVPYFSMGDYYQGLKNALVELKKVKKHEARK